MSTPTGPEEKIAQLLSRLWEKHRATVLDRVKTLENAVQLGALLTPNDRERAQQAAHKLAGSLGTFGYKECGEHAREVEQLLGTPLAQLRMRRFVELVGMIRAGLPAEHGHSDASFAATPTNAPAPKPENSIVCDVLIVEDDELLSGLIAEALASAGFGSYSIADGAEATRALTSDPPQVEPRVVLLDVDLPGIDGLTLLRTLATKGLLPQIRVVMLTGHKGQKEVMESLGLGACGFIAKPFDVPAVLERVQSLLSEAK